MPEHTSAKSRGARVPLVLAAGSKFGKYKPEIERDVRKVEIVRDRKMQKILRLWKTIQYDSAGNDEHGDAYNQGVANGYRLGFVHMIEIMAKRIGHGAAEVGSFALMLPEIKEAELEGVSAPRSPYMGHKFGERAGLFLSALINSSRDSEHVICLVHMDFLIDYLGCGNRKKLTVIGDVGKALGCHMSDGEIIVEGNAKNVAATFMCGGKILVKGNVGDNLGYYMCDGEVVVEGDADYQVASDMEGGKITVKGNHSSSNCAGMTGGEVHFEGEEDPSIAEGDFGVVSNDMDDTWHVDSGPIKIYHKGKLIVDK